MVVNWLLGLVAPSCAECVCSDDSSDILEKGRQKNGSAFSDLPMEIQVSRPGLSFTGISSSSYASKLPGSGFQTYSSAPDQPLLGVPIKEGELWHLSTQDRFEPVTFHLYVNGFAFSTPDGMEASVSLSPFSLVRNCRFQAGECAKLKSFKVSLLDHDPCCYFATRSTCGREAEEERSDWVLGISHTILLITESLLPPFAASCDPLPGKPHTDKRLLAGYLIHRDDAGSISVLFCELHAHSGSTARLQLYEDDRCETPVMDVHLTDSSACCDIVGINCSCFIVDTHHFASQTPSERKLWLRALSNVKVKLQNRAPEPSEEELEYYRESIREHIRHVEATLDPRISTDALLARRHRKASYPFPDGSIPPQPDSIPMKSTSLDDFATGPNGHDGAVTAVSLDGDAQSSNGASCKHVNL
eukprot:TRINITY_DN6747_c0_g1_i1.p1 TRINITY_DN6747_c0_g1~~TRINITY_DN6747_c0_g1_i1.p1  ORF type:complete len:416 (-),score=88.69 TRINITY_DN6747_c0_g1_i1:52-1299(-)